VGFDEKIIAEAVLTDQPPKTAFELAQSITLHDGDEGEPAGNENPASAGRKKWPKWLKWFK
jgi:hypothetical protein